MASVLVIVRVLVIGVGLLLLATIRPIIIEAIITVMARVNSLFMGRVMVYAN